MPLTLRNTPPDTYWDPPQKTTPEDPLDQLFEDPEEDPQCY